jgi:Ni/Co efflux regulator RcnB
MKRLLIAATALSLVAGSAAMAQPYNNDRHDSRSERHDTRNDNNRYDSSRNDNGRYDNNRHDNRGHHWARGQRLPSEYRTRGHYVDYRRHHLRAPPRGYQWVQVDNNYVMVALASGLIASIIANN